jgi:dihydrofolate synthase/folylpolyglutamate synthase
MRYAEAVEWLFGRRRLGMKYGLERMEALLGDLGSPQEAFRTVHVVGTNGKGSTTGMISAIARELGIRTGRYTSPHLLDFRERIAVDGSWIPPAEVCAFVSEFRPLLERHEATFFEIATAMAAWHFRNEGVSWAAVEAGLGGRLDATRTFRGECTVFTGVDIEHRRILGRNRTLIAREKLAIAEPGSMLVCARQHGPVERAVGEAVDAGGLVRVLPAEAPPGRMPGAHQARNASLAAAASRVFGREGGPLDRAVRSALGEFRLAGRQDLRSGQPAVLFDVAHNPQSVSLLVEGLERRRSRPAAVVGFLADKPWRRMASMLAPWIGPVVATTPLSERMLPAAALRREFDRLGLRAFQDDPIEFAMARGRSLGGELLLVTGSFYVVGEAMLASWRNGWIEPPAGEEAQFLDTPEDARIPGLH